MIPHLTSFVALKWSARYVDTHTCYNRTSAYKMATTSRTAFSCLLYLEKSPRTHFTRVLTFDLITPGPHPAEPFGVDMYVTLKYVSHESREHPDLWPVVMYRPVLIWFRHSGSSITVMFKPQTMKLTETEMLDLASKRPVSEVTKPISPQLQLLMSSAVISTRKTAGRRAEFTLSESLLIVRSGTKNDLENHVFLVVNQLVISYYRAHFFNGSFNRCPLLKTPISHGRL